MPAHVNNSGRGIRANKKNDKLPQTREVTISKNLTYLLRHGAKEERIVVDEGGWVNVADVLLWRRIASLKVTLSELNNIVTTNDKQRYQLIPNPKSPPENPQSPNFAKSNPSQFLIRAVQGHSINSVLAEQLLTPVSASDPNCPMLVVHGTYSEYWDQIKHSGGLKPMSRNHIHFATKEPDKLPPLHPNRVKSKEEVEAMTGSVISGMRRGATTLIWVDVRKSMEGGVKWWRSHNNVFLTDGLERKVVGGRGGKEKTERVLELKWVRWVERRGDKGEILWKNEDADVAEEKLANEVSRMAIEERRKGESQKDGESEKVVEIESNGPVKESWDD